MFRGSRFSLSKVWLVSALLVGGCDSSTPTETTSNPMVQESPGTGGASGASADGGKRSPSVAGKGGTASPPKASSDDAGPGEDNPNDDKRNSSAGSGGGGAARPTAPEDASWAYQSAECERCVRKQKQHCFKDEKTTWVDYCLSMPNKAAAGPKAGTDRSQLCKELLSCVRKTKCDHQVQDAASGFFTSVFTDCYCGPNVDPFDCFTGTADKAVGACKKEIEAAAESTELSEIETRIADPEFASGVVDFIYETCDAFCPYECGACKPGAMICHQEYTCVPVASDGSIVFAKPRGCAGSGGQVGAGGAAGNSSGSAGASGSGGAQSGT